jgi:hypothetical protein
VPGKNKQPLEMAILNGQAAHNPQRYRNKVPKNEFDLGEPPEHVMMITGAPEAWAEFQKFCVPGVLTEAERHTIEIGALLMAEFRSNPIQFPTTRLSVLLSILSKLGMNPCDRQKLGVPNAGEKAENKFSKFQ